MAIGAPDLTSNGDFTATQSSVGFPATIAFDNEGNFWVTDGTNSRVLRFPTPFSTGMNADLVLGQPNFTSKTQNLTQSGLDGPLGVAIDSSDDVFVADSNNSRILEFKPPLSSGMNASVVIGQADFTTSTALTSQSGLNTPVGLYIDSSGNLWVADDRNERVLEFKPPFTTGMNASLVLGQPNFTTANAPAPGQNTLSGCEGVAVDTSGDVFVTDTNNNRIMDFEAPLSNGMNASVVIGQADFTHSSSATTQSGLKVPRSQLGFDSSGNLWVVDNLNNRVLEYVPPFTTGMDATLVIGQSDFISTSNTGGISGLSSPFGAAFKP